MAIKKMRIDFSKVEERGSYNSAHIPPGVYAAKVTAVSDKDANDGTGMWTYTLVPTDTQFKTRAFPWYCKHQENQFRKVRDLMVAVGVAIPQKAVNVDPNKPIGQIVAIDISDSDYNGNLRSEVNGVYPISILEDLDSPSADSDDEDDEEYDDEYDESDEDETSYDEDEDEEDYDEDDEDDYDEDDLPDEDEDDDEEEPAPKKSKKEATAKKSKKDSVKAAPKRVVKRKR